jgi:hypothetical protein
MVGVNNTATTAGTVRTDISADFGVGASTVFSTPPLRYNISATQTVYAVVLAYWTGGGSITTQGVLRARRMR